MEKTSGVWRIEKNEAKSAEFFLCYLVDSDFRKEYCI